MNNNLSPLNDISMQAFDDLFSRFQNLDTECILVYLIDKVEESSLIHLAEQFHITGNEGWLNCTTTQEKRELLKNSLKLHRYRGTKFALTRVLEILGLEGHLEEWFEYGGSPYYFKIYIDLEKKSFASQSEKLLLDLIMSNKNVRSKLENLIMNIINSANSLYASYCISSEEIIV